MVVGGDVGGMTLCSGESGGAEWTYFLIIFIVGKMWV